MFRKLWRGVAILSVAALLTVYAQHTAASGVESEQSERFNMSYIYFGNSGAYTSYVDDTKGSLDDISPSYFDLNEDGSLKLTPAVDRSFVKQMHERGVKVTPFLSNHWDRQVGINALANRKQLAEQIAAAIIEYNLDGVNIDIENVTEKERDSYTDFVKLLREKLPAGKSLSVAVAPNPWNLTTGWHGSYDYVELARYSDYLMVMAYDEHYQGSVMGPVASYSFVEKTIVSALKDIPAEKIVIGIAFYGRLWKQGSSYGGYGISNNTVEKLISEYRGKVVYDKASQSPKATITILAEDIKPKVFGKELEAGIYDIWYENEESIKSKLALAGKYGLKGTGSWSLGQETKETWEYYSLWLNSKYFSDIQNSWAKEAIVSVMQKGWMTGVSSSKFMPGSAITRAQAATVLVRLLGIDASSVNPSVLAFKDTKNHWARIEIEAARINGLVEGTGAGRYEPDKVMTREQMAVLLERILKMDLQAPDVFEDVTQEHSPWSYAAVNRMAAASIMQGYPDGRFYPKNGMTREQLAVLIHYSASKLIQ